MFSKNLKTKFFSLILQLKTCRGFLAYRMASAKEKSSPEFKNKHCLTILNCSAGRHLDSISNQEKLPNDGLLFSS